MKHVHKQVLIWYSPAQMYALVTDVARYPEFLPWCASAAVIQERPDGMTARLGLSLAGVKQQFTTQNTHVPDEKVSMELLDGPFSKLHGVWTFASIGDGLSCKVTLDLTYAFSSTTLSALVGPVFDKVAATLVDAFVQRAEQVYGAGAH
jgi:ribosome-associated toxin RatA of RatAB toxin-antitoxin module